LPITLVTRSGAAGTSHNLTHHLSAISPEFKAEVGVSLTPKWPEAIKQRGALLGARGGDGVAAQVKGVPGAIGYVAYPHASLARVPAAAIENKAGNIVSPAEVSFAASMQSIQKNPAIDTLVDPPGDGSYPMIAVSWVLMPKQFDNPAKKEALVQIIEYALGPGQELAKRIGYIPFSPAAIAFVRDELGGLDTPE
jgi:phosphate transport system substrate-binding protein